MSRATVIFANGLPCCDAITRCDSLCGVMPWIASCRAHIMLHRRGCCWYGRQRIATSCCSLRARMWLQRGVCLEAR
jgi:hypothetical protein